MKLDTVAIVNKVKENLIGFIILVVALNLAIKVAVMKEKALSQLNAQKETEIKKSQKLADILALEKQMASLRQVVNAKQVERSIDTLGTFAKDAQVKIVLIKPQEKISGGGFTRFGYELTLSAANYHQLGKFIDLIEHSPDIFVVENLLISGPRGKQDAGISATMTLSTIVIDEQR